MRIAMVGPFGLHPNKTMRSRALNLARVLARRGHEIAMFMPPWQTPQEEDRWWEEDGVMLRYTALGNQPLSTARNLVRDVQAWQPEIIHGFKPKAYSGMAMWWFWQLQRQSLHLVADMDDWEGYGGWNDLAPYTVAQKRFFAWQEQWGMDHAHVLTVASRALQSIVWSNGVPAENVSYLPNGSGLSLAGETVPQVEVSARRKQLGVAARPTLLLYSRLFEFDTDRLADVLARVKAAQPDLAVLTIGQGLYEQDARRLREQLEEKGVLPAVVDLGWVEETELPILLRIADVAVFLMEDTLINRCKCPVKLADLIAAGVPVVAENVGQVAEYVEHGVTGYLRPSGDIEGLSSAIGQLLRDDRERAAFGLAAQRLYQDNFAWNHLADRLEVAYGLNTSPV